MVYVPKNKDYYLAALTGAITGMGAADRIPASLSATSHSNVGLAKVAGAWAEALDTNLGPIPTIESILEYVESASYAVFQDRAPNSDDPSAVDPSTYTNLVLALLATLQAEANYLATKGINQSSAGSSVVKQVQFDQQGTFPVLNGGDPETTVLTVPITPVGGTLVIQGCIPFGPSAAVPDSLTANLYKDATLLASYIYNFGAAPDQKVLSFTYNDFALSVATNYIVKLLIGANPGSQVSPNGVLALNVTDYVNP